MKKSLPFSLSAVAGGSLMSTLLLTSAAVLGQEVDNTQTLPDAQPGECYAKVITPAKFETRTETVVVREAAERIETVPAVYETVEQTIVLRESGRKYEPSQAEYEEQFEKIEVRPAETSWTATLAGKTLPASPGALEGIRRSGIDLEAVDAKACFVEYYTEPEYKIEAQRVMQSEGGERIVIVPAEYETVEERIVVKEASSRVVDVPAVYRTETQSVLVEPARSVWKAGRGPIERIDNSTGEIMCLVEVPARYETITKTVLDKPATTKTVGVPAAFKTIKVQRLVKAAEEKREVIEPEFTEVTVRTKVADSGFFWLKKEEDANADALPTGQEVCLTERPAEYTTVKKRMIKAAASVALSEVPAELETVKVQRLVTPASERRVPIPAREKTITRRVQVDPSKLEWRPVLCETNMTPKIVTSLQRALKREGHDPGPIDGVVGQGTLDAIEAFQLKNELDRGGLTYETLKQLKVQS